ncbi:cation:proton antiporter [Streptomyces sp. NPDC127112]|uniref:cation:proton antiporter domain-containing protein n=1 Tax=Streptomyces sp. NPDC127112 TaxID=3345364 RepID=UPI00364242B1
MNATGRTCSSCSRAGRPSCRRRPAGRWQSRRILVLITPLLTYTTTVAVDGNGFVAAFVCGIAFRYVRQAPVRRHGAPAPAASDFQLVEDTSSMMTMIMWFFFGNAVVLALSEGVQWPVLLLCVAALTVVRIVPIGLAFLGSRFSRRERLMVGALGPRGTTSIVFGLLAFNALPLGPYADTALDAMTLAVLGCVLLHGGGSMVIARLLAPPSPSSSPSPSPPPPLATAAVSAARPLAKARARADGSPRA